MLTDVVTVADIWPVIEALLKPMYSILGGGLIIVLVLLLIVKLRNKK